MPRRGPNSGYRPGTCKSNSCAFSHWEMCSGIEKKNQKELERIARAEEAMDLTDLDLAALSRGDLTPAVLIKLTTADINTFARRRENHIFKRFLVEAVGVSTSCSDCMAMKRVEEWAQDTMFHVAVAARDNEADEDTASTSSKEPEGDGGASVVKSDDAGEEGPHFEGDDLIAF